MKKLFGTLVAVGAMALMAVGVQAATYTSSGISTGTGTAEVAIQVTPDASETVSINGYVMTLTYDSSKVTPQLASNDVMDEECYATVGDSFKDGVIVSDIIDESGTYKTLAVAWAGAEPVELTSQADVATVDFTVDATDASDNSVIVTVMSLTNDGSAIDKKFIRGDADGNGDINAMDALLVAQYTVGLNEIDEQNLLQADVDYNDDVQIDAMDALLLAQYTVGLNSIPE